MKSKYKVLILCIMTFAMYVMAQEFIKPKAKNITEHQDIELDGELIFCSTDAQALSLNLSQTFLVIIQDCINKVNNYANGNKSERTKKERNDQYHKKLKLKKHIEEAIKDLNKILHEINNIIVGSECIDKES